MTTFNLTQTSNVNADELNGGDQVIGRSGTTYNIVSVGKNGIWVMIDGTSRKTRLPRWAFEARK